MTNSNIECPVDLVLINERKARLTAGSVSILAIAFLFTRCGAIPIFFVLDFFLRGFNLARYSLLNTISDGLIKVFNIQSKPVDRAPKRFAAKIGLWFSVAITVLFFLGFIRAALAITIVLIVFALLESVAGLCAGCYAYHFYKRGLPKPLRGTGL